MLSLPKILLLLAVVVVVVLISKSFRGKAAKADDDGGDGDNSDVAENGALDLSQCAVCGNFVAPDSPGCERDDCPLAN